MLTDYHVHLRPDETDASPDEYFTAENVDRYLEAAAGAGIAELGVSEHVHRFTDALEIWDHPFWKENALDDLDAYCEFVRATPLRLGIEMDFVPGREDRIANLLESHDFDYVVGSVHFLGSGAVDDADFDVWTDYDVWGGDPDRVWAQYFETLAEAARTGLYDILAHPDLVKIWGHGRPQPRRDPRFHYEPAVEAIAETGVAVEVSTAGWRRPVDELYPADALAEMCVDAGAVFALSSDAHEPDQIGYAYDRAVEVMRGWGVGRIAVFERRERRLEELGVSGTRVGIGYDSHRFAPGRRLVLGGVEIEHELGLEGHSDADVLTHAVIDALLGAAGLGDLGAHFPADDERWRDADSLDLLRTVLGMLPGPVVNVDSTVVCESVMVAPHRALIERNLTEALGAPASVKATSNERMGWVGRGEGIACVSVALVDLGA